MQKIIFFASLFLALLAAHAQPRCVVLDFQIGDNVTAEEVDAVTYEFRSTFNPSCYTVEDYLRVKRILKELGYNPASMKKEQVRKFGREMVASIVVYASLSKFMDEYSLDVSVMDVSSGTTLLSKNCVFQKSEYRTYPRSVSEAIASELCSASYGPVSGNGSGSSYNKVAQGFVDLGLPSGTKWKKDNEDGFYTYDQAKSTFKVSGKLPTKEQFAELKEECEWRWTGSGYKVTGPNGNSISLPASGLRDCGGGVGRVGSCGLYWSSTPGGSEDAWGLDFRSGGVRMRGIGRCGGISVRLVQD